MYARRNSQPALLLIMFIALELILSFIPATQWLDLGGAMPASLILLPVVLAGALLGSGAGALLGLVAGVCRLAVVALLRPSPLLTPLFSFSLGGQAARYPWLGLLTCLIPPMVTGLLAAALFRILGRILRGNLLSLTLAGAGGALAGAALMWLGILINLGGLDAALRQAMLVNTGLEILACAVACALPGTLLYHRFVSEE